MKTAKSQPRSPKHAKTAAMVKALRQASGLNCKAFGKRYGVSDCCVSHWECGRTMPVGERLTQLEVAYERLQKGQGKAENGTPTMTTGSVGDRVERILTDRKWSCTDLSKATGLRPEIFRRLRTGDTLKPRKNVIEALKALEGGPTGVTPTRSPLSPSLERALMSAPTCPACEQPLSQEKLLELARNALAQRMLNGMGKAL